MADFSFALLGCAIRTLLEKTLSSSAFVASQISAAPSQRNVREAIPGGFGYALHE
jgi:hypothetical protein